MEYIIIAPHPDDELIGCFTLFKRHLVKKVIYIESSGVREREAENFCSDNNVTRTFLKKPKDILNLIEEKDCIYMVPSINDHHPLHKIINAFVKSKFRHGLYSIDMNTEFIKELHPVLQKEKREWLNKYFPSQKSLWENDWKYFLFEGTMREV